MAQEEQTQSDDQERTDRWRALGIRTDMPHPARVYDYLLGGCFPDT